MPVVVLHHDSDALRDNPLGDPHLRALHVIVPHDADTLDALPCVWWLAGFAGVGRAMLSHDPWQEGLEERLVRLRREGRIGPMIVALPDAFTRFGGAQYLGSPAVGDYETYLLRELRALVEARFRVAAHAIAGKSSGGFGAIVHAMRNPGLFRAVACHSGDMGFKLSLTGELPALMNAIHEHGSLEGFVRAFDDASQKKEGRWFSPISVLALAAVYSPEASSPLGIALPFDLARGEMDEAVFARWLAWDPVSMIDEVAHQSALRDMKLVYFDCGKKDEYQLHWGARAFHHKLTLAGVAHEYEEFSGGHRNTSHRLDESLPKLYRALTA